jgi:hypothetical protein
MAILAALVGEAQTLLLELELVALEHQDKETLAAQALAVLIGLVVVAAALLRLVQIIQPQIQAARVVLALRNLFQARL